MKNRRRLKQWWTDADGKKWRVPNSKGRLRPHQIPGHKALRNFIFQRDGYTCQRCLHCNDTDHGTPIQLHLDHVLSWRNGGKHHPDNLQTLCARCNVIKSNYEDRGRDAPTAETHNHNQRCFARGCPHPSASVCE